MKDKQSDDFRNTNPADEKAAAAAYEKLLYDALAGKVRRKKTKELAFSSKLMILNDLEMQVQCNLSPLCAMNSYGKFLANLAAIHTYSNAADTIEAILEAQVMWIHALMARMCTLVDESPEIFTRRIANVQELQRRAVATLTAYRESISRGTGKEPPSPNKHSGHC